MISKFKFLSPLAAGIVLLATAFVPTGGAVAQEDKESIRLPADPDVWLNSPPISSEILKGKAAILYFFEEG